MWPCWDGQHLDRRLVAHPLRCLQLLVDLSTLDPKRHKFHPAELESFEPSAPTLSWGRAIVTAMGTLNFSQPGHVSMQMKTCWSWCIWKSTLETDTWVSPPVIFLLLTRSLGRGDWDCLPVGGDGALSGGTENNWQWVVSIFPELTLSSAYFGDIFLQLKKKVQGWFCHKIESHNGGPESWSLIIGWHHICTFLKKGS